MIRLELGFPGESVAFAGEKEEEEGLLSLSLLFFFPNISYQATALGESQSDFTMEKKMQRTEPGAV